MGFQSKDEKKVEKKKQKSLLKLKKSRIIIRNLSFKANEDIIKESFGKFGNVIEVNIPKKPNGKMFGFAFVGFDSIKSSLKAIKYMNEKQLLNRTIAVDFALAKKAFTSHGLKSEQSLQDNDNNDEKQTEIEENDNEVKDEILDEEQVEDESDDEYFSDDNSENDAKHSQSKKKINVKQLTDASEEKTIFVRNLSFGSTAESLNELMSQFGETVYCKICIDESTEHSKGTAFVKFKNKTDADKCLREAEIQNNNNFYLDGRQLNVSLAFTRNKLKELEEKRSFKEKDKRNLYLAKEGLIYPESPAAEGVSQTDLKKRLALETKKRKMLQNNHYFVSKTRLCIHNLPPNFDDRMLRTLFSNAVDDKNAKIIEARVMKDRKKLENKFGKSKGFGFVAFVEHIHALKALRNLNNNPNIFTPQKRPIVEFSIENKVALNKKKHREKGNKIKNNSSLSSDDKVEEQSTIPYSGVQSRPANKSEKIKAPKVNRKLTEMKNKLKVRGKKLQLNKVKANNEKRHKEKLENRKLNKTQIVETDDIHDQHYRKRKNIFKIDNNDTVINPKVKKRKWFYNTHK